MKGRRIPIRVVIERDSGRPHCEQHGVTAAEATEVLRRNPELMPGYNDATVALGTTSDGRYLRVVFVRKTDYILIITAMPLHGLARKAYQRRQRRRGKA